MAAQPTRSHAAVWGPSQAAAARASPASVSLPVAEGGRVSVNGAAGAAPGGVRLGSAAAAALADGGSRSPSAQVPPGTSARRLRTLANTVHTACRCTFPGPRRRPRSHAVCAGHEGARGGQPHLWRVRRRRGGGRGAGAAAVGAARRQRSPPAGPVVPAHAAQVRARGQAIVKEAAWPPRASAPGVPVPHPRQRADAAAVRVCLLRPAA